jgi:hypothetical protein
MKQIDMTFKNDEKVRILVEKYFDGMTSLKEEKVIRQYFAQNDVVENLKNIQPLFLYLHKERERTVGNKSSKIIFLRWTSVAAACLLLFFGLHWSKYLQKSTSERSLAYIDGVKCTDTGLIYKASFDALNNLSNEEESVIFSQIEALEEILVNY